MKVVFGDESPWDLPMTADNDGLPTLQIFQNAVTEEAGVFVEEFMRETFVEISYNGNRMAKLSLKSSRVAFNEVVACTKSYRDATRSSDDPFRSNTPSADPFSD